MHKICALFLTEIGIQFERISPARMRYFMCIVVGDFKHLGVARCIRTFFLTPINCGGIRKAILLTNHPLFDVLPELQGA